MNFLKMYFRPLNPYVFFYAQGPKFPTPLQSPLRARNISPKTSEKLSFGRSMLNPGISIYFSSLNPVLRSKKIPTFPIVKLEKQRLKYT